MNFQLTPPDPTRRNSTVEFHRVAVGGVNCFLDNSKPEAVGMNVYLLLFIIRLLGFSQTVADCRRLS